MEDRCCSCYSRFIANTSHKLVNQTRKLLVSLPCMKLRQAVGPSTPSAASTATTAHLINHTHRTYTARPQGGGTKVSWLKAGIRQMQQWTAAAAPAALTFYQPLQTPLSGSRRSCNFHVPISSGADLSMQKPQQSRRLAPETKTTRCLWSVCRRHVRALRCSNP